MKVGNKENSTDILLGFFWGGTLLCSVLPLTCGYLTDGGMIAEEMDRVMRFASDHDLSFLGAHPDGCFLMVMFVCQVMTILLDGLFLNELTGEKWATAFGTAILSVIPARIFACYDQQNYGKAFLWMIIPLLGYAVLRIVHTGGKTVFGWMLAVVSPILICCALELWQPVSAGPYQMEQLFHIFFFMDGFPGYGITVLIGLPVLVWFWMIDKKITMDRKELIVLLLGILVGIAALDLGVSNGIREIITAVTHRAVETELLVGISALILDLVICKMIGRLRNLTDRFYAVILPAIISGAGLLLNVYYCNMLTFSRLPFGFME
ncbi:MAG: hypothetical protein IJ589_01115 [Lachnospiraceae bacterium]|nr:hypothetical protein [Lachnospiraceae bacterium]